MYYFFHLTDIIINTSKSTGVNRQLCLVKLKTKRIYVIINLTRNAKRLMTEYIRSYVCFRKKKRTNPMARNSCGLV